MAEYHLANPANDFVESPPEVAIARDMVRRALPVAPVFIILGGLIWGVGGGLSAAYGLALVLINFTLAAFMLSHAAKVSPVMLMAASLGGFLLRMGFILGAILLAQQLAWVVMAPLLITILVTHLGLLFWETRYVSANLAYPGLAPVQKGA